MEIKRYEFWAQSKQYGEKLTYCYIDCKYPERTKVYKELLKELNNYKHFSIGYEQIN